MQMSLEVLRLSVFEGKLVTVKTLSSKMLFSIFTSKMPKDPASMCKSQTRACTSPRKDAFFFKRRTKAHCSPLTLLKSQDAKYRRLPSRNVTAAGPNASPSFAMFVKSRGNDQAFMQQFKAHPRHHSSRQRGVTQHKQFSHLQSEIYFHIKPTSRLWSHMARVNLTVRGAQDN